LLNRNVQLSLDYSYTSQTGTGSASAITGAPAAFGTFSGSFTRNVALLAVRLAL
jgi:hypothetical protein